MFTPVVRDYDQEPEQDDLHKDGAQSSVIIRGEASYESNTLNCRHPVHLSSRCPFPAIRNMLSTAATNIPGIEILG